MNTSNNESQSQNISDESADPLIVFNKEINTEDKMIHAGGQERSIDIALEMFYQNQIKILVLEISVHQNQ